MISKVNGKAEVSLYLFGDIPVAVFKISMWLNYSIFYHLFVGVRFPATRHPCAVSGNNPVSEDWVWANPPASKHSQCRAAKLTSSLVLQGLAGKLFDPIVIVLFQIYIAWRFRVLNGVPHRSTANKYSTNFRATASVARFLWPRSNSFAYNSANCSFHRGASFAASINTVCKCLLRCFEIGPRFSLPADSFWALHSPRLHHSFKQLTADYP